MLVAQNWLSRLLRGVNPSWDGVSAEEMDAAFVRVGFETEGFEPIPETTGPLVIGPRAAQVSPGYRSIRSRAC